MTYRERREARADRLREWAEKRERKAEHDYQAARQIADRIPFGQPILVGHHSEGRARRDAARIDAGMRRSIEHAETAARMTARAATIDAQAASAIYSDDPDALDRIRDRIADLEGERDRIKAYNASCRKGTPDLDLLTGQEQRALADAARYAPGGLRGGQFPAYHLTNLTGNIARQRKRLQQLEAKAARQEQS